MVNYLRINRSLLFLAFLTGLAYSQANASDKEEEKYTIHHLNEDCQLSFCEFLDPVSLHRLSQTSAKWFEAIRGTYAGHLFLPEDKEALRKLFASENFASLFRKASNTKGGLVHIVSYPAFFPSHFKNVYPLNVTHPIKDPLCQQEFNFIRNGLIKLLPAAFKDENGNIKKGTLLPNVDELNNLSAEDAYSLIDDLWIEIQKIKIIAVLAPEIFQEMAENITNVDETNINALYLTKIYTENKEFKNKARKIEIYKNYLAFLKEDPNSFHEFISSLVFNASNINDSIFQVISFGLQVIGNAEKIDYNKSSATLSHINYFINSIERIDEDDISSSSDSEEDSEEANDPVAQENSKAPLIEDKTYKQFKQNLELFINSLLAKAEADLPAQLRLKALETLHRYLNRDENEYLKHAIIGAENNVYTNNSLDSLADIAHPKTAEGVFNIFSQFLHQWTHPSEQLVVMPPFRHLKFLIKAENKEHRKFAERFVREFYNLDKELLGQDVILSNNPLDTCAPVKILMQSDVVKAKEFLISNTTCQQDMLAEGHSESTIDSLIWSAKHFVTLFNDIGKATEIIDGLYKHAVNSQLATEQLIDLTNAYIKLNNMEKAKQCLVMVKDSIKDIEEADHYLLSQLAAINAYIGNTEHARQIFLKALDKGYISEFNQAYESKNKETFEDYFIDIYDLILGIPSVLDLSFSANFFAPAMEKIKDYDSANLMFDTISFYIANKLGLNNDKEFLFTRFQKKLVQISRSTEKEELATFLNIPSEEIDELTQAELIEKIAFFHDKEYAKWSYKESE